VKAKLSIRSIIPPCPGNKPLPSFTPASRLTADIVMSPKNPHKPRPKPSKPAQIEGDGMATPSVRHQTGSFSGVSHGAKPIARTVVVSSPPNQPSHVF
jgi:hypothetical protein